MALEDLTRTGLVHLDIKNPVPGGEEQLPEEPIGFIPAERASTSLVAGQTEVNPLAIDLPDTQLMASLTNYTGVNFNASLVSPTVIGSSKYMTASGFKRDATTGGITPPGDTAKDFISFDRQMTDIIDKGQTDFTTLVGESYEDYRNRLRTRTFRGTDEFGIVMAGQEPYDPFSYSSTAEFVKGFQGETVVGNIEDYRKLISSYPPVNMWGAGKMVWNTLKENAFIKGVKNNPDKYLGNNKYVKDAENWFAKQAQKQFGAVFEENPTVAIRIAEANKAMYAYLNSTINGQKKIREMGLNLDGINTNYEQAKAFEAAANRKSASYSAYQGKYSGSAEGVAAKKIAYANMSQKDLDDTTSAGSTQYSGMAVGGQGIYVDISDGMVSGTKFKSGTIFVKWKKEERERRAAEEAKKEKEVIPVKIKAKPEPDKPEPSEKRDYEKVSYPSTITYQGATKPTTGFGSWFASKEGGRVKLQEGGVPIDNPIGQQPQPQQQQPLQDAGNLELIQEQGKDQSGVADDVKRQLNEGDFVINAPAREMAGHSDIERMITKAITELQRKGVKLDFGQAAEDPDSIVQALVSNKELIIPKIIAEQIGYDRLEKINNRGKERVDEIEKERAEQEKGFVQQNPQGQSPQPVQAGGIVTLEENKNQPIAVPRESFATMSSVGKRLLSPLAPEQQDREKELEELSKPSQSFEGFMKPIGMTHGGKIHNNPGNIEIGTDAPGKIANQSYDSGRFAAFSTKEEGLAAIPHTLEKYDTNNVADVVNIWKPLSETGNTSEANKNTIDHIIKGLGKDTFDLNNPNDVKVLIEGITRFDSGTDSLKYYDSNSIEKAADMYLGITTSVPNKGITPVIKPKPQPDIQKIADGGEAKEMEYKELTKDEMIDLGMKAAAGLAMKNPTIKQNIEKFKSAIDLKLKEVIPNEKVRNYITQLTTEGMITKEFDLPKKFKGKIGLTSKGEGFLGASLSF